MGSLQVFSTHCKGQKEDDLIPLLRLLLFPKQRLRESLISSGTSKGRFLPLLLQKLKVSNQVNRQSFFNKEELLSMGFADILLLHGVYVSSLQEEYMVYGKSYVRILEIISVYSSHMPLIEK